MIEYESDLMPLFSKAVYSRQTNIDTQSIVDCVEDFLPEDVIVKYGNIRL